MHWKMSLGVECGLNHRLQWNNELEKVSLNDDIHHRMIPLDPCLLGQGCPCDADAFETCLKKVLL